MSTLVDDFASYVIQVDRIINQLAAERNQLQQENQALKGEIETLKASGNRTARKEKRMATTSQSSGSSTTTPTLLSILNDPTMSALFGKIQGLTPTGLTPLSGLINNGVNSPLLQSILGPALQRLMGTEDASRQAVTDAFRASGGLRSSQYGRTFDTNENNIMNQRSSLISDTIAKTLGTLVGGQLQEQQNSFLPARTLTDLFQAARPAVGSTTVSSQQSTGSGDSSGLTAGGESMSDWLRRVGGLPTYGPGSAATGVNSGGAVSSPGAQPSYDPYGGYGFSGGYPVMQNPYSGVYQTYDPNAQPGYYNPYSNQNYQDYGSYAGSYGLGYQDPGYQNPNISYGAWQQSDYPTITGEY